MFWFRVYLVYDLILKHATYIRANQKLDSFTHNRSHHIRSGTFPVTNCCLNYRYDSLLFLKTCQTVLIFNCRWGGGSSKFLLHFIKQHQPLCFRSPIFPAGLLILMEAMRMWRHRILFWCRKKVGTLAFISCSDHKCLHAVNYLILFIE